MKSWRRKWKMGKMPFSRFKDHLCTHIRVSSYTEGILFHWRSCYENWLLSSKEFFLSEHSSFLSSCITRLLWSVLSTRYHTFWKFVEKLKGKYIKFPLNVSNDSVKESEKVLENLKLEETYIFLHFLLKIPLVLFFPFMYGWWAPLEIQMDCLKVSSMHLMISA